MKEFYIDEKGNKRRLRFSVGDFIIVEKKNSNEDYVYRIMKHLDKDIRLVCPFCTDDVCYGFETKRELQKFLLNCFNVKKVIEKKKLHEFLEKESNHKLYYD